LPRRVVATDQVAASATTLPLTVASNTGAFSAGAAAVIQTASPHLADLTTLDPAALAPIVRKDPQTITYRIQGRTDGWGALPVTTDAQRSELSQPWNLGVVAGQRTAVLNLSSAQVLSASDIRANLYTTRAAAASAIDLTWSLSDVFAT